MSLFKELLRLNTGAIPLEDTFTEIVAYLFRVSPATLFAWLEAEQLLDAGSAIDAHIRTQVEFAPLPHHTITSRPDLFIEVSDRRHIDLIMIESKIGSLEGVDQLSRYADILAQLPDARLRVLIYITRDHDPKNPQAILAGAPNLGIRFIQLRWHRFYHFLRMQPQHFLIDEIILFMQEYRMAQSNQFSAADILALAHYHTVLTMMDETMWSGVDARFAAIVGGIKKRSTAFWQLQHRGRYIMVADLAPKSWWAGLGYHLRLASPMDYPTVRLMLEVSPNSPDRSTIIDAFHKISQRHGWHGSALTERGAWAGVLYERSLRDFLAADDHIYAIQQFFLAGINDLAEIKEQYPHLPWRAEISQQDNADEPDGGD